MESLHEFSSVDIHNSSVAFLLNIFVLDNVVSEFF